MTYSVAVAGASGYAGGEVLRLLLGHPEMEIGALCANSNAGEKLGSFHPHLRALADRVLQPTSAELLAQHDVVVLALPHGASGEISAQLPENVLVLDCGADHRLESEADWLKYYKSDFAGTWTYGMPELLLGGWDKGLPKQRALLTDTNRVAVPGCNVTAVTLALAPGIAEGLLDPTDIVAVLACGLSGAGKGLKPHLLAAEILNAASPYAVGGTHRHIPEIEQNLRHAGASRVSLSFTPTLVPMSRGILATCTAKLATGVKPADLRHAWEQAYGEEQFVSLLPEGQWPNTQAVLGANTALIQLAYDEHAERVVLVSAIDNLVKGTAGAAVQSMNLALGLRESTGLTVNGVAP